MPNTFFNIHTFVAINLFLLDKKIYQYFKKIIKETSVPFSMNFIVSYLN